MHLCICEGAFRALPTPPSNSCRKLVWKSKVCGVFSFVFLSSCWQSARMTGPTVRLGKQRLSRYETAWESEAGRLAEVCRHPGCSLELYSCCTVCYAQLCHVHFAFGHWVSRAGCISHSRGGTCLLETMVSVARAQGSAYLALTASF